MGENFKVGILLYFVHTMAFSNAIFWTKINLTYFSRY